MGPIAAAAALAATQHGAISRRQLDVLGVSEHARERALEAGWLTRAGPGVFAFAGSIDSVRRRLWLGLLQLGPAAVVSHEAAAMLHRLDRARPDVIEFTVPRRERGRGGGLQVHSTDTFGPHDRLTLAGLPCTSATRTIIDLARIGIGRVRLEAAIDSAVRQGSSSPIVLATRLRELRRPGWRGARQIDALLPDSGGHSPLERRFLTLIRHAGLPRPTTQVVHRAGRRTFARVDFCFEDHGLVVEVSGRLGHVTDAERERDIQRRNELSAVGRTVREFSRGQVYDQPAYVLATVRQALTTTDRTDVSANSGTAHPDS